MSGVRRGQAGSGGEGRRGWRGGGRGTVSHLLIGRAEDVVHSFYMFISVGVRFCFVLHLLQSL